MIETVSGIPDFDEYGNLPYACYEVSLDEIEEHFVKNFSDSDSRKSRFECFLVFYKDLIRNVKSGVSILIDGSFVENKNNPCDVDLVIIIDSERLNDFEFNYLINELKYNEIIKQEYLYLKKRANGGLIDYSKLITTDFYKFGCDIHYFPKYPQNHPLYERRYKERLNYWVRLFGKDRQGHPKGFLNLTINYGDELNE